MPTKVEPNYHTEAHRLPAPVQVYALYLVCSMGDTQHLCSAT
jgi:hypothetical protein